MEVTKIATDSGLEENGKTTSLPAHAGQSMRSKGCTNEYMPLEKPT